MRRTFLRRSIGSICGIALFSACTAVPNVFCDTTTVIPKFEQQCSIKGELLTDSVWLVTNIFAHDGLVVAMQDRNADRVFRIITSEGQSLGQFGTRGRADNEFLNTFFHDQYHHNAQGELVIWIGDLSKDRIIALNIHQSLARKSVVFDRVIQTPTTMSMASLVLSDSLVCLVELTQDNFRLIGRNTPSNEECFSFDFFKQPALENASPQMYLQSQWCLTPDRKNIINAMGSINQINRYAMDTKSKKVVSLYSAPKMASQEVINPNEGLPLMMYYKKVICDSNYIYALYSGVEYAVEDQEMHHSHIHVFDHDLNPIREMHLDKNVYQITIDPSNATLYGLGYDGLVWKFPYLAPVNENE